MYLKNLKNYNNIYILPWIIEICDTVFITETLIRSFKSIS